MNKKKFKLKKKTLSIYWKTRAGSILIRYLLQGTHNTAAVLKRKTMGAAASNAATVAREKVYKSPVQRKAEELEQLYPKDIADIKIKRLLDNEVAKKLNRESALHKMQETLDEETDNPLAYMMGLAKLKPPRASTPDQSPESYFMRKKMADDAKMDWEDPEKKKQKRTEDYEDQSKYIIRMSCDIVPGYEIVSKMVKRHIDRHWHSMEVDALEVSDLFDFHVVFKEKLDPAMFYCKSVIDWPDIPDYMDPACFNFIILQFKASQEEFKSKKVKSIEEKCITRLQFLRLLVQVDLTCLTDKRIELGWDPLGDDPITSKEEPLLQQFEAKQVLNYYKELDSSPESKDHRVDKKKIGRISMKDALRIVMGTLIAEASEYAPLVGATSTFTCNQASAMDKMKVKRRIAAEKLEAKSVGKLGRMRGPKQDIVQVVRKVAFIFHSTFFPVLDDVVFFEFVHDKSLARRILRRNSAWEFIAQMDSIDLIRAMKRLREIPTLNQDLTGWTEQAAEAGAKAAAKGVAAIFEEEETTNYIIARWLRKKILSATHRHGLKHRYGKSSALQIATMKKKAGDDMKEAQAKMSESKKFTRKVLSVSMP